MVKSGALPLMAAVFAAFLMVFFLSGGGLGSVIGFLFFPIALILLAVGLVRAILRTQEDQARPPP